LGEGKEKSGHRRGNVLQKRYSVTSDYRERKGTTGEETAGYCLEMA